MSHLSKLQTAELDWELVDGIDVPISKQFGDVYFSKDNGLLETRHVFLNGNDLTERLSQLSNYQYFCVGETGFGTGLNILTLWQLWQQIRPNNHSHLHVISVEKFPLSKADLIRALNVWTELKPFAEKLQMNLVSTKAEFKNGIFTGNFIGKNCNGLEKLERIKKEISDSKYDKIIAFGDTSGDKPMLKWANEGHYQFFH